MRFEGINIIDIDDIKARTIALSDKNGNPIQNGFVLTFYKNGEEVNSFTGVMIPIEGEDPNQRIPNFKVDFSYKK